jgi:hypothetical protein
VTRKDGNIPTRGAAGVAVARAVGGAAAARVVAAAAVVAAAGAAVAAAVAVADPPRLPTTIRWLDS